MLANYSCNEILITTDTNEMCSWASSTLKFKIEFIELLKIAVCIENQH